MSTTSWEKVLSKYEQSKACQPEHELELIQALLDRYADHRGTGEDAKWSVITREFNARADESCHKSEASAKRLAKKITQQRNSLDEVLSRYATTPVCSQQDEQELLRTLGVKYFDHRGTGEDSKWLVIVREFNARATQDYQKSEAAVKRAVKKLADAAAPKAAAPAAAAAAENKADDEKNEASTAPSSADQPSAKTSAKKGLVPGATAKSAAKKSVAPAPKDEAPAAAVEKAAPAPPS